MPNPSEAEEHLRVIRSLMEKATIYRAISAPTALIGGLLSLLFAFVFWQSFHPFLMSKRGFAETCFLIGWLAVLAATGASNTFLIWKDARRRGDPFVSRGMQMALQSLFPSFFCAGFATFAFASNPYFLPPVWMVCYGVGLLATSHFAPGSIGILGWAFLLSGLVTGMQIASWDFTSIRDVDHLGSESNMLMAATFGLFHVIYAACTWPRRKITSNCAGEG